MSRRILVTLIVCLTLLGANAQVSITPTGNISGFQLNQLNALTIMNTGSTAISGIIEISLIDSKGINVLRQQSYPIQLAVGDIQNGFQIAWESIYFGNTTSADFLRTTNQLTLGNYVLCYVFRPLNEGVNNTEYCQEFQNSSRLDFELISPYDTEVISTLFPMLIWEPLASASSAKISYSLILKPLNKGQSPSEAISVNFPLFSQNGIISNQLVYPNQGQALEYGKTYVWQVEANDYSGEAIAFSSIWVFTIKETSLAKGGDDGNGNGNNTIDTYPLISLHSKSVLYLNQGNRVNFAYDNWENKPFLEYKLISDGPPDLPESALPEVSLTSGLNTISMHIPALNVALQNRNAALIIKDSRGDYILHFHFDN